MTTLQTYTAEQVVAFFNQLSEADKRKVRQEIREKPSAENGFAYTDEDMDISVLEQIRYGLMEVKAEREGKHKMLTVKEFFDEFDKD
ncbi:MAG: hypothetical protein EAZ95_06500 [Bacteroidetes bacterium]|nr:MAG: hypothetical protein EAZ95_06500 [Bacteroidota bacterium]